MIVVIVVETVDMWVKAVCGDESGICNCSTQSSPIYSDFILPGFPDEIGGFLWKKNGKKSLLITL